MGTKKLFESIGFCVSLAIAIIGGFMVFSTPLNHGNIGIPLAFGQASSTLSVTSTVVVGNADPVVSAVTLNNGSSIVLTPDTTTSISVNATITDNNGCADITNGGTSTIVIFRSGITSSTCRAGGGAVDSLNCYRATAFTASSTCASNTTNTTTTFSVQYFAQATDASSSFASQNWIANVSFRDPQDGSSSIDSSGVELLTLTAINVTTSSINYGTLSASSTTGSTNQTATTTNAGNSSTTLQLSTTKTLTSGSNSIATSSQRYSTSTFTFAGTSTALTNSPVTVGGHLLTSPTSTANVSKQTFWGLEVPAGTATGTYNGFNLFTSLFQP